MSDEVTEQEPIVIDTPVEYEVDLNNLPGQQHNWVDRGLVLSCEGAGHPNHQAYKGISV